MNLGKGVMRKINLPLRLVSLLAVLASAHPSAARAQSPASSAEGAPLDAATLAAITALYHQLIDAENRHDLAAVRTFVWESPDALFVAKTATAADGNWAGFWCESAWKFDPLTG
jgi:hypothetical protein